MTAGIAMTGRCLFRMVVALTLVAAPLPGGPSLRGEDDTVVDAAEKRAQEQGQKQEQEQGQKKEQKKEQQVQRH